MISTFHLLTGEYPPQLGGVGDYTHVVARALAARGSDVHVWCPTVTGVGREDGVHRHRLPDTFGRQSARMLEDALAAAPGCVLLQYVPNALGARGANLRFCLWLRRLRRRGTDVRVMFHEPYFYFAWQHPLRNLLAALQRVMARVLLEAAGVAYLSTETWIRYLGPLAPEGTEMVVAPIPSTVPSVATSDEVTRWRARFGGAAVVGHFGTFGDHVAAELREAVPALLRADPRAQLACIGQGSERFVAEMTGAGDEFKGRMHATGPLGAADVSAALRACDVVMQPYPDGVTTRRTSVMAGLANEVATVTTAGFLSEPVWATSGAVALAPAADPRALTDRVVALLRDAEARRALAATGRRVYDTHFAVDRTVDLLLTPAALSQAARKRGLQLPTTNSQFPR